MKNIFKRIIIERQEWLSTVHPVKRNIPIEPNANYVFTGLRRAGKSYMLYQIIQEIIVHTSVERILMVNFEDERLLEVSHTDLHLIMEAYAELFEHEPIVFFDEIQNVPHWQKFVRRLADDGHRIYLTGSNAEMLSAEIASTLGGRFINQEVLPLGFDEYLIFKGIQTSTLTVHSKQRFEVLRAFHEYLFFGGFPELLRIENKREYLSSVYQKLFYGDLIARYKVSNANALKLLVKKLAESVNNETSVNRIKNLIASTGVSMGNSTIFDYLNYLESSFLIASIPNHYSKFAERESTKKYYFLDTGILGLFLIDQPTKLLENLVYIELRRRGERPFFVKKNHEVDFFLPDKKQLIQVSYSLRDPETATRELRSLRAAMRALDIQTGLILSYDETDTFTVEEGVIQMLPVWQWLLRLGT